MHIADILKWVFKICPSFSIATAIIYDTSGKFLNTVRKHAIESGETKTKCGILQNLMI